MQKVVEAEVEVVVVAKGIIKGQQISWKKLKSSPKAGLMNECRHKKWGWDQPSFVISKSNVFVYMYVFVFSRMKVFVQNSVIAIFILVFVCFILCLKMWTWIFAFIFFLPKYLLVLCVSVVTLYLCICICSLSSEVLCELVPQVKQVELDPTRLEAISSN